MNAEEYQDKQDRRYESRKHRHNSYEQTEERNYVGYDYMELTTEESELSFLLDSYETFGWEPDQHTSYYREHLHRHTPNISGSVTLSLKRDRKIMNKTELIRLQRNFEACVRELDVLEKSKTSKATALALIIGFIGTVFMAGSVFAIVAEPPHVVLCVLLAIPAFIGWLMPYFVYRKTVLQESARIDALIEQKYDEIHAICERGSRLLY